MPFSADSNTFAVEKQREMTTEMRIKATESAVAVFLSMLPDMPYAGITVPACLKIVVFRFLVVITYE